MHNARLGHHHKISKLQCDGPRTALRRATAQMRLRLADLQQLLGMCEAFAAMAEGFGARPAPTLRNAVQVQSIPASPRVTSSQGVVVDKLVLQAIFGTHAGFCRTKASFLIATKIIFLCQRYSHMLAEKSSMLQDEAACKEMRQGHHVRRLIWYPLTTAAHQRRCAHVSQPWSRCMLRGPSCTTKAFVDAPKPLGFGKSLMKSDFLINLWHCLV